MWLSLYRPAAPITTAGMIGMVLDHADGLTGLAASMEQIPTAVPTQVLTQAPTRVSAGTTVEAHGPVKDGRGRTRAWMVQRVVDPGVRTTAASTDYVTTGMA